MGLSGQDITELLAWILFVAGAIWVPIKFHKPHYNPFEQKALLILGIVPGSVLLIILGLYKSFRTHIMKMINIKQ